MTALADLIGDVRELFRLLGKPVTGSNPRGDNVVDLYITTAAGEKWIICCVARPLVDEHAVDSFHALCRIERPVRAALISSGKMPGQTRALATGAGMEVLDGSELAGALTSVRAKIAAGEHATKGDVVAGLAGDAAVSPKPAGPAQPPVGPPEEEDIDDKWARMVTTYRRAGYKIVHESPNSATLEAPKLYNWGLFVILSLLTVVFGIFYLIFKRARPTPTATIRRQETGVLVAGYTLPRLAEARRRRRRYLLVVVLALLLLVAFVLVLLFSGAYSF